MSTQKPHPGGGGIKNSMNIPGSTPKSPPTTQDRERSASPNRSQPSSKSLPEIVFFDSNGHISGDLLTTTAEKCADSIRAEQQTRNGPKPSLTAHQLRRFYGDVKDMERKVSTEPNSFSKHWPVFSMLKAKAAYASNPKNKKIPAEFRQFIDKCVDQVNGDEKAFKAFCLFFEAVVGYCYGKGME